MKLARFTYGGRTRIGVVRDDRVIPTHGTATRRVLLAADESVNLGDIPLGETA
jgi:hypothetical protein